MNDTWMGADQAYVVLQQSEPDALHAMAALPDDELKDMKLHADMLLEGLHDLPENALAMRLIHDMVKNVRGISLFIEVMMLHKAKVSEILLAMHPANQLSA